MAHISSSSRPFNPLNAFLLAPQIRLLLAIVRTYLHVTVIAETGTRCSLQTSRAFVTVRLFDKIATRVVCVMQLEADCHRDVRQRKSGDVRSRDCPLLLLSQRDFQTNSIMRRELQHLNQRLVFSWKTHEPVQSSRFAHGMHMMNLVCRAINPMCVCLCVCRSVCVCVSGQ